MDKQTGMKTIAHLSSVHAPFDTRVFRKQCCSLAAAGYDVHLVVRHDRDEVVDGVRITALSTPRSRLVRMTGTILSLWREARKLDADLYHFHDPELLPLGVGLRLLGKPVVYDAHENYAAQIRGKPWVTSWLRRPLAWCAGGLELLAVRAMSAVVAAGRDIEARFRGRVRRLIRVENFPILDPRLFEPRQPESGSFTLVNFGGVWSARATGEQVEALGLLPQDSQVRLILGGRVFQDDLDERIRGLAGWSRVEPVGLVDRDTMTSHFRRASAAIVLYSDKPNHHSIRSNRVYEAMAAGLPVVVSDFAEWGSFIERHRCGLAVDPSDPSAIAEAFTRLAEDPVSAAEMGARGQRAVREYYNWENQAEKLCELYGEILGGAPEVQS